MRTVRWSEAKQKFSLWVERASKGAEIGITRRGKVLAVIEPARITMSVAEAFADIEKIRKRAKPLKGLTINDLIEEGR